MSTTLAPETEQNEFLESVDEVGQVLEKAADLIEERGWWSGPFRTGTMGGQTLCAGFAIIEAADLSVCLKDEPLERFSRHIGHETIPSWNDRQPDAQTVIRTLREAAASH